MNNTAQTIRQFVEGIPERLIEVKGSQTTASFARFLGVGVSTLYNYENGRIPPVDFLLLVADKTGVSLDWLLTGRGPKYPTGPVGGRHGHQGRPILVVDDKDYQRESIVNVLEAEGYTVHQAEDVSASIALLDETPCDVVVTDLRMPDEDDGLRLLRHVQEHLPGAHTIIITVHAATARTAVEAVRQGAFDYLVMSRTFPDDLRRAVANALEDVDRRRLAHGGPQPGLEAAIGVSPAVTGLREWLPRAVEASGEPVLVSGEPGTGKEFVAKLIHYNDPLRHDGPFVPVKCGTMEEDRLARELFGQAEPALEGVLARADGGTVFLDEIDACSLQVQIDLLRAIEDRGVTRRGDVTAAPVDVRLVCATHADLEALVAAGAFRRELLSRLSVLRYALPPLRERPEDIPLLARAFLKTLSRELGRPIDGLDDDALELLVRQDWPDNVRGLRHVIQRAVVFCDGKRLDRATVANALGRQLVR